MAKLKKDLQAVTKGLKALTKKTERLVKAVDKLEKAQAATKRKAKPKAKPKTKRAPSKRRVTAKKKAPERKKDTKLMATDQVLRIIKRSKKGVGIPTITKTTGFNDKKVRNIVARAFKMKKIKRVGKGVYVGA